MSTTTAGVGATPEPEHPGGVAPRPATANRSVLLVLAALLVLGGVVTAATPLGRWIKVSIGAFEVGISGFGGESSNFPTDDASADAPAMGEASPDEDDDRDDDLEWLLGPVPDGVPVTLAGLAISLAGLIALLRAISPAADPDRSRRESLVLAGGAGGIALVGLGWTLLSYWHLDDQFSDALGESVEEEPFGAMFLGSVDFGPGYGVILAGIGFLALLAVAALAFVVSATRMQRLPVTITVSTGATTTPAPPPPPAPSPE